MTPTGKEAGALLLTDAPSQRSTAVAVPSATPVAKHWFRLALAVTFTGQVMTGAVVSMMATTKEVALLLPAES